MMHHLHRSTSTSDARLVAASKTSLAPRDKSLQSDAYSPLISTVEHTLARPRAPLVLPTASNQLLTNDSAKNNPNNVPSFPLMFRERGTPTRCAKANKKAVISVVSSLKLERAELRVSAAQSTTGRTSGNLTYGG